MITPYLIHLPPGDSAHDRAHVLRVWANAQQIGQTMTLDWQVLAAATALHDLVTLPKDHPDRATASRQSAAAAMGLLAADGFPPGKRPAVAHAIEAHSFSAGIPPETPEAQVLRDADRLDALGLIGLARLFATTGALGRAFYDPGDPYAQNRPLDETAYAFDHVQTKLLTLADTMCTGPGRALAQARTATLRRSLAALAEEIGLDPRPA